MSSSKGTDRFASVAGLGGLERVYAVNKRITWKRYVWAGASAALGILVSLGGFTTIFFYFRQFGVTAQNQSIQTILIPTVIIAVVLFGFGAWAAWTAYKMQQQAIAVYKNGVAVFNQQKTKQYQWDQIHSMTASVSKLYRNGSYTGITHTYTISDQDGKQLVLDDRFEKIEELAGEIRKGIFPHIYRSAATNYNSGKVVSFGTIQLSKSKGLKIKQHVLNWDDVSQVCVQRGYLRVAQKNGSWVTGANTTVAAIPNLDVLLTILDQVVGIKVG